MAIHTLAHSLIVHAPLEECWRFFADPRNLARITPPALGFEVLSEVPPEMYAGLMIAYRVRPLFGIPMQWLTEITHLEPLEYFVDEQRVGPYRVWHHEHRFRALDGKRTEVRDLVHYVLPFGVFGEAAHPWLVAPQLKRIFAFREEAIGQLFQSE